MSVKKAKTKSMQNVPKNAKNIIDGKICLCSTSRVIDKIPDKYDTTTNELQNAEGNTNAGFVRLFHHIKSILKQYELIPATSKIAKSATVMPIIRFKCSTQKYIRTCYVLSHILTTVRMVK